VANRTFWSENRGYLLFALGTWLGLRALRRSPHEVQLAGKNVLVTGGSRGLGLEIARVLVEKGANVAIVARDMAELARADEILRQHAEGDVRIFADTCDLGEPASIEAMLERVRAHFGPIDVLVNNAGMITVGPVETLTRADFEAAMRLHYFGPLELMLRVRDEMRARGGGRIANVASIGGLVSVPHLLPYSGSKSALVALSRGMRTELARDGIVVTTISPGLMRTGSPRHALVRGDHAKEYAWFKLADSVPGPSMSARRAAKRIVRAIERGEADVVFGMPAKVAAFANAVAPGAVAFGLGVVERLLPEGGTPELQSGSDNEPSLVPPPLTALTSRAEVRNNER